MTLKRIIRLIIILSFFLLVNLLANNEVFATSDRTKITLVKDGTSQDRVNVYIDTTEEASITSFQLSMNLENVSNAQFEWCEALEDGQLEKYNFDSQNGKLNIYYVGTEELNNDENRIQIGTIWIQTITNENANIKISPVSEKTVASSIGYTKTNFDIKQEDTLIIGDDSTGGDDEKPSNDITLSSTKYKIGANNQFEDGDIYIFGVAPLTKAKDFMAGFETNANSMSIYKSNNIKVNDDEFVGTGMTLKATKADKEIILTIVVTQDLSGDGEVTTTDLSKVIAGLAGDTILTNIEILATDIDKNNDVTVSDLSSIIDILTKI